MEKYDEVIVPSREGIVAYLSSGQIKGIGPVMAERVFDAFGMDTLSILDKEPERLLEIRGISSTKLEKITQSYHGKPWSQGCGGISDTAWHHGRQGSAVLPGVRE